MNGGPQLVHSWGGRCPACSEPVQIEKYFLPDGREKFYVVREKDAMYRNKRLADQRRSRTPPPRLETPEPQPTLVMDTVRDIPKTVLESVGSTHVNDDPEHTLLLDDQLEYQLDFNLVVDADPFPESSLGKLQPKALTDAGIEKRMRVA